MMKELPEDLAVMRTAELSEQRAIRDDKLATLFQRWPALNRLELRQLRKMYGERLRSLATSDTCEQLALQGSTPGRAFSPSQPLRLLHLPRHA